MKRLSKAIIIMALFTLCYGCGHTKVCTVGLMSTGELEGKTIPDYVDGPVLIGKDISSGYNDPYFLSEAVRNALKDTKFNTLIDVEVTTKTGLFVWSNKIEVKGIGVNSNSFPKEGGEQ